MKQNIISKIEEERKNLCEIFVQRGSLLDSYLLKQSRKLDALIVGYIKNQQSKFYEK